MPMSMRERREFMRGAMSSIAARGVITLSILVMSFVVLGVGIAVAASGSSTVCIAALRWPTLFVGIAFVVLSILGFLCCISATSLGSDIKNYFLVGLFFVLLALSIMVVYSNLAVSGVFWGSISACLSRRNTCDSMGLLTISPVQSGCCKPPPSCAFITYVNGTTWSPPTADAGGAPAAVDDDCSRWSDDPQTLCFQCDSCKASVLGGIKGVWQSNAGLWTTVMTIFHVLLFCVTVKAYEDCE